MIEYKFILLGFETIFAIIIKSILPQYKFILLGFETFDFISQYNSIAYKFILLGFETFSSFL
ncbi:Uncharacterised protein [Campylobacter hyointestinalis]|nr:Uncharacterised protein [Campylobacter hyointestinalis]